MSNNLYFIRNCGCDDETKGLAIISDEDFPKFKEVIENLNKNSSYQCMPVIRVYKTDYKLFREAAEDEDLLDDERFYFDGKVYTFDNISEYDAIELSERVI